MSDPVRQPAHYTNHPSGITCIQVVEDMSLCCGSAVQYIWRHRDKGQPIQDLEKAVWYLEREIDRLKRRGLA